METEKENRVSQWSNNHPSNVLHAIYHVTPQGWGRCDVPNKDFISNEFAQLVWEGNNVLKVHAYDMKFLMAGVIYLTTRKAGDHKYTILFHDGKWNKIGADEPMSIDETCLTFNNESNEIITFYAADLSFLFSGAVECLL
jgi:hypothetical protein